MRLIDADALMNKLNGIWDCNDMTFAPVDGCCIDADCKSCRWRETIEYVKRLVQNQTTISSWHRVEEPPRDGQECIIAYSGPTDWIYEHATYHSDLNKALEEDIFIEGTDGFIVDGDIGYTRHSFNYWMPIEPPKEDA